MIQNLINNLEKDLAILTSYIENQQKTGFHDMERLIEVICKEMFNTICNVDLVNLNLLKMNFPAIDLSDEKKGIAIQVTTNASPAKIRSTIKKFEKLELGEKYTQLYIIGFCRCSKVKGLDDRYIIIDKSYLVQKLIEKNDAKAIDYIINTIRQHIDYSSIHPYDDIDCLSILLNVIDRNAIKHRMSCEGSYSDMVNGLNEITELISKGQINGKEKSKSIDNFYDTEIIEFMIKTRNNISKILAIINTKKEKAYDFVCLNQKEMENIDKIKLDIVSISNDIASKKSIKKVIHMY